MSRVVAVSCVVYRNNWLDSTVTEAFGEAVFCFWVAKRYLLKNIAYLVPN